MAAVSFSEMPDLNQPHLVLAFEGWPNAGEAATRAVAYLRSKLGAQRFAHFASDDFYVFTALRPLVTVEGGLVRRVRMPSNEFYFCKGRTPGPDLVLFLGAEPHLRWSRYLDHILEVIDQVGIRRLYTLGSFYGALPHTLEPQVTASATEADLVELLARLEVHLTDYEGPTSFHTTLLVAARERGIAGVGLWGAVPHYIQAVPNPNVSLALLQRLTRLLELDLDLTDLRLAGEHLNDQISRAVALNPELGEYIARLEQLQGEEEPSLLEPIEGEEIVKELEEFLRHQRGPAEGDPQPEGS